MLDVTHSFTFANLKTIKKRLSFINSLKMVSYFYFKAPISLYPPSKLRHTVFYIFDTKK